MTIFMVELIVSNIHMLTFQYPLSRLTDVLLASAGFYVDCYGSLNVEECVSFSCDTPTVSQSKSWCLLLAVVHTTQLMDSIARLMDLPFNKEHARSFGFSEKCVLLTSSFVRMPYFSSRLFLVKNMLL
jgi:hypothetical protein